MKTWLSKAYQFLKTLNWVYVSIIAVFFYAVACYGNVLSLLVPTYHMDGAFQTASGLFRLLRGELPGRDFYPYLGIGPIGLIFPVFLVAGANLCASIFAAFMTVYAADILSIAIIIHLLFKPKRFLVSVVSACALFSIPLLLITPGSPISGTYSLPFWLEPILFPGNSLRPLRGFIAYAAVASLYFFIFPEKNRRRKYVYYGLTLGITSLWSNDYALLTMASVFLLALGSFIKESKAHFIQTAMQVIFVSIASVVLMQWLVTGGHPLKLVIFNFVDVASDQWWYFGSWAQLDRIFSLVELNKLLPVIQTYHACYVLGACFVAMLIVKRLRVELLLIFTIGLLLVAGATVASAGGHIMTPYFDCFMFWSKLISFLFVVRLAVWLFLLITAGRGNRVLLIISMFLCTLIIGAHAYYADKHRVIMETFAKADIRNIYVPELGGYMGEEWKEYLSYARTHQDKTVIEEYWGVWSAFFSKPSIWPVDSAIHALGSVRQTAEKALREKADIVITSNRTVASIEWFSWSQANNYWLYKALFDEYTPVLYSPTTIVWEKNKSRRQGKEIACKIADSKDRISLEVPAIGYYEVQLQTNIEKLSKNRYLIMFENNMNFSFLEQGKLSVSPFDEQRTLIVYVSNVSDNDFGFETRPAGAARVAITSCTARDVPFKNEHVLLMSEGVDKIYGEHANDGSIYSDTNFWHRGFATKRAGFFVFKDKKAIADYTMGRVVELPNKEKRAIASTAKGFSAYLEVTLTGPILTADETGVPTTFKLLDDDEGGSLATQMGEWIFITDDISWQNGISRIAPIFIMPNTPQNRELYKYPNVIQLPDTTQRIITSATTQGVFLLVSYQGDLLDAAKTGSPGNFKLIEVKESTPSVTDQSEQGAH